MVKGLDIFRTHFQDYGDRYVLIGGTACDIAMTGAGLAQQKSKDSRRRKSLPNRT
jgi:hypothetical protein